MMTAVQLIAFYAFINPATVLVALYMGLHADQPQKIPIAALMAGIAGMALVGLVGALSRGASWNISIGHERAAGGMFIALLLVGLMWSAIAYLWRVRGRR
jgi:small neutral amino acid transporter SnatA (MarC family)